MTNITLKGRSFRLTVKVLLFTTTLFSFSGCFYDYTRGNWAGSSIVDGSSKFDHWEYSVALSQNQDRHGYVSAVVTKTPVYTALSVTKYERESRLSLWKTVVAGAVTFIGGLSTISVGNGTLCYSLLGLSAFYVIVGATGDFKNWKPDGTVDGDASETYQRKDSQAAGNLTLTLSLNGTSHEYTSDETGVIKIDPGTDFRLTSIDKPTDITFEVENTALAIETSITVNSRMWTSPWLRMIGDGWVQDTKADKLLNIHRYRPGDEYKILYTSPDGKLIKVRTSDGDGFVMSTAGREFWASSEYVASQRRNK